MVSFRDDLVQHAFRTEVRSFLDEHLPEGWRPTMDETAWLTRLKERGWYAPAWPTEYGGSGLSVIEQFILNEELAHRRAPRPNATAMGLAGPTIITHGNAEQKARFIPSMLVPGPESRWCQLYSEPGAGSDLASLKTSAVRDGDNFVVNGQKIWTSGGHLAKWAIMLARTDPDAPKHRGITYFIVDMKSPGVDIRPLINMANEHRFNEVFLEDVVVPAANVIGEVNRGWYVGTSTLNFERSSISTAVEVVRRVKDIVRFARESGASSRPPVREALSERYVESEIASLLSYRVISMQARGQNPAHESAIAKLYHSELTQRVASTGMKLSGLFGQVMSGSQRKGPFGLRYLLTVPSTIGGGTSEIQRNVIAMRGLGLPRD